MTLIIEVAFCKSNVISVRRKIMSTSVCDHSSFKKQ